MFVLAAVVILCVSAQASAKCCMPNEFEITEGYSIGYNTHGHNGKSEGEMRASVDATKKMIAVTGTFFGNGKESKLHIIQDYTTVKQYVIDLKTKTCTESPLLRPWVGPCVTANATLLKTTYYGKRSSNFMVDLYMVRTVPGVTSYLAVSEDGCIPVGESVSGGVHGFNFMMNVGFSEYTKGIKDKSVFVIPDSCNKEMKIKLKVAKMHRPVPSIIVPAF